VIGAFAALLAFVAAGVGAIIMVRRRPSDPVTQFRRQIDALSAESRRSVITQRSADTPRGSGSMSGPATEPTEPPIGQTGEPTPEPETVASDETETEQPPVMDDSDSETETAPGGS
jgi:hypothetical protein